MQIIHSKCVVCSPAALRLSRALAVAQMDAQRRHENRAGNERLQARFASMSHGCLVETLTRIAHSGRADKKHIDNVISGVAPLPAWCVDVMLSPDLIPHILGSTCGRESHRAAHVCSAWAAWRRRSTQTAADDYVAMCTTTAAQAQSDARALGTPGRLAGPLVRLLQSTICRPSFPTFGLHHLLEAESQRFNSTWLPACGFSLQPASLLDWLADNAAMRKFSPGAVWKCRVPGIDGTLMDGGLFTFDILFLTGYPLRPPVVVLSKCGPGFAERFHNQIYMSGKICSRACDGKVVPPWMPGASRMWDPSWSVVEILIHLLVFLHRNNNNDPANEAPSRLYRDAREMHDHRVRDWAVAARAAWDQVPMEPSAKAPLPPDVIEAALQEPQVSPDSSWVDAAYSIPAMTRVANGTTGTLRLWRTAHLIRPTTCVGDVQNGQLTAQVAARAAATQGNEF